MKKLNETSGLENNNENNTAVENIDNEQDDISEGANGSQNSMDSDKKRKLKIIIPICVAVVILITAVFSATLFYGNSAHTNSNVNSSDSEKDFYTQLKSLDLSTVDISNKSKTFIKGITISGYDISGMTYNEVYTYIETNGNNFVEKMSYVINCDGVENTLTEADFVFNLDVLTAVNHAYAINTFARNNNIKELKTDTDIEVSYEIESESISMAVSNIANLVNDKATGVELVSFDSSAPDGEKFVFKDKSGGKALDVEDVSKQLSEIIKSGVKTGTITCSKKVPEGGLVATELNKKMSLISSFKTHSTNGANGNHNMSLAMSSVNGTLLNAGETFSFNACTGNSNLSSLGYLPAGVIMNGKSDIGIGGGICQASTTIYNAAIRAGMAVVERYPHAWPSTYAKQGLDATIDYPGLDLKLKNNADTPIYLECYMKGVTLTCNVYGVQPEEWDEITCDSWVTSTTSDGGFNVAASRTYWLNGKEVKTEALKSSHYSSYTAPVEEEDDDESSSKKSSSKSSSKTSSESSSSNTNSSDTSSVESFIDWPSSSVPSETNSDISSDYTSSIFSDIISDVISSIPSSDSDQTSSNDTSAQAP